MKGGEEILHIDNICKNFNLGRGKVLKACDCVDIIVHKAETVGIVGESGSGKSTVAKMLTRLYDICREDYFPWRGYYSFKGGSTPAAS